MSANTIVGPEIITTQASIAGAIGRVFQSSAPIHFAIVEGLDVPGSSMRHFPPRVTELSQAAQPGLASAWTAEQVWP